MRGPRSRNSSASLLSGFRYFWRRFNDPGSAWLPGRASAWTCETGFAARVDPEDRAPAQVRFRREVYGTVSDRHEPELARSLRTLMYPKTTSPSCGQQSVGRSEASTHRRSEEHTSELQSRGHLVCRL